MAQIYFSSLELPSYSAAFAPKLLYRTEYLNRDLSTKGGKLEVMVGSDSWVKRTRR